MAHRMSLENGKLVIHRGDDGHVLIKVDGSFQLNEFGLKSLRDFLNSELAEIRKIKKAPKSVFKWYPIHSANFAEEKWHDEKYDAVLMKVRFDNFSVRFIKDRAHMESVEVFKTKEEAEVWLFDALKLLGSEIEENSPVE